VATITLSDHRLAVRDQTKFLHTMPHRNDDGCMCQVHCCAPPQHFFRSISGTCFKRGMENSGGAYWSITLIPARLVLHIAMGSRAQIREFSKFCSSDTKQIRSTRTHSVPDRNARSDEQFEPIERPAVTITFGLPEAHANPLRRVYRIPATSRRLNLPNLRHVPCRCKIAKPAPSSTSPRQPHTRRHDGALGEEAEGMQ